MIVEKFVDIAHRIVWCTVATVDTKGRPRSRVMHPYWERTENGLTGWVVTRPTPLKRSSLRHSPFVSCSYWDPAHDVAVAECAAQWETDPDERARVWRLIASAPPPVGWDPSSIFPKGPTDPLAGVLRLSPWRLSSNDAANFAAGGAAAVWRREPVRDDVPA